MKSGHMTTNVTDGSFHHQNFQVPKKMQEYWTEEYALLGTNISPEKSILKMMIFRTSRLVGYVNFLEGRLLGRSVFSWAAIYPYSLKKRWWIHPPF